MLADIHARLTTRVSPGRESAWDGAFCCHLAPKTGRWFSRARRGGSGCRLKGLFVADPEVDPTAQQGTMDRHIEGAASASGADAETPSGPSNQPAHLRNLTGPDIWSSIGAGRSFGSVPARKQSSVIGPMKWLAIVRRSSSISEDLESTREEMRQARRGHLTRHFECRYVHADGRVMTLTWTGVWSEPEQQHFFIGRDITEAADAERQLRQRWSSMADGCLNIQAGESKPTCWRWF